MMVWWVGLARMRDRVVQWIGFAISARRYVGIFSNEWKQHARKESVYASHVQETGRQRNIVSIGKHFQLHLASAEFNACYSGTYNSWRKTRTCVLSSHGICVDVIQENITFWNCVPRMHVRLTGHYSFATPRYTVAHKCGERAAQVAREKSVALSKFQRVHRPRSVFGERTQLVSLEKVPLILKIGLNISVKHSSFLKYPEYIHKKHSTPSVSNYMSGFVKEEYWTCTFRGLEIRHSKLFRTCQRSFWEELDFGGATLREQLSEIKINLDVKMTTTLQAFKKNYAGKTCSPYGLRHHSSMSWIFLRNFLTAVSSAKRSKKSVSLPSILSTSQNG